MITSLLVVAILAGVGAGYLVGAGGQRPTSSASTSTTTMTLTCALAPKGSTLYIKTTLNDGKTPATNITIDATPVETCNGVDTTIALIYHPAVNASGVATLDASDITYYSVTVHYGGQSYPFTAYVQNPLTCASLSVPSGVGRVSACYPAEVFVP